jgi:cytochrome P450
MFYFTACPHISIFFRAISRDPVAFPNPETFDAERWLDSEGRVRDDMKSYPFGYGRRYVLATDQ